MLNILNILSGGIGPLLAIGGVIIAVLGAVFGIHRAGVKTGRAQATAEGADHVQKSIEQANKVNQTVDGMSVDDARAELRRDWSRPDAGNK